jgi:transposase
MPKCLTIEPHLSVKELEVRYRQAKEPIERTRYQIVWLLAQGFVTQEVAAVTGYRPDTIRKIARRYNQQGSEGIKDRRYQHPGGQPMLSDVEQAQLWQALQSPPADGGLWNGRKVAEWISDYLERRVGRQRGWEYLREMTFRWRVPRPEHEEAYIVEQEAWKKKLAVRVNQVQAAHPEAKVELWSMDEQTLVPR